MKLHGSGCRVHSVWVCMKSQGAEASLSCLFPLALTGARPPRAIASFCNPLSRGTTSTFLQSQPASRNWLFCESNKRAKQFYEPSCHGSSFYLEQLNSVKCLQGLCEEEEEQVTGKKHPCKGASAPECEEGPWASIS